MLIVGTNTYANQTSYINYCNLHGYAVEDNPESLLIRATIAIDRFFLLQYPGQKGYSSQPLGWPRVDVPAEYSMGIPQLLTDATCEMANLIASGVNVYAEPVDEVTSESNEVAGAVKTSKTYKRGKKTDPIYQVRLILQPILAAGVATGIKLVR